MSQWVFELLTQSFALIVYNSSMVLLNAENRMITLRQNGALARIKLSISGPRQLTLKAESMGDLIIDVNYDSPVKEQVIRFR